MKYQTLLFDADDTLLNFPRSEKTALSRLFADYGIPYSEELRRCYHEGSQGLWRKLERGEIDKPTLLATRFKLFFDRIGRAEDPVEANARYIGYLSQKAYHMPHAVEVCRTLARHCKLYVITNGVASVQHGRWLQTPLKACFEEMFVSEEIGAEKPSEAFFRAVLERVEQKDLRRILVVGDSVFSDIEGGRRAGLDTCLYRPKRLSAQPDGGATYCIHDLRALYELVGIDNF